jgi:predicted amidophosphoribosyltransferase
MGMIECPQCGKQISDQAGSCPECGFSVKVALLGRYLEERQKEHPRAYQALKFFVILVVFSLVFWLLTRR